MLSAHDVVKAVVAHLHKHGYITDPRTTTRQRRYHIVAKRDSPPTTIYVRARVRRAMTRAAPATGSGSPPLNVETM
jgi:hypothetical protein